MLATAQRALWVYEDHVNTRSLAQAGGFPPKYADSLQLRPVAAAGAEVAPAGWAAPAVVSSDAEPDGPAGAAAAVARAFVAEASAASGCSAKGVLSSSSTLQQTEKGGLEWKTGSAAFGEHVHAVL